MGVRRRQVFYFSGFDPRGPAYYQRLYRTESIKQAAVNGMPLSIHPIEKSSDLSKSWRIQCNTGDATVETTYEFMRWDDIIRSHWQRNEVMLLAQYIRSAWIYFRTGALHGVLKAAWPPFVASMLPMLGMILLIVLASLATYATVSLGSTWQAPAWLSGIAGLLVFGMVMHCGRLIERQVNSFWLLRIFAFTIKQGRDEVPELETRLDNFARRMAEHIRSSDDDEILIVGHSTGTMIAVSALARALTMDPSLAQRKARISLITLGHCIPILSLLPQAQRFRDELAVIANAEEIDWIDFTAPTDGACFAFVNPVELSGIEYKRRGQPKPKLLSPRYPTLFSPEKYARIRRDWYRNHFQYLMAGEKAGDYDYFAITAGRMALADRFRSKPSVKNFTGLKVFQ